MRRFVTIVTLIPPHGLAFCALVHKFHPEMINFTSLSKENALKNNQLAFTAAEKLGKCTLKHESRGVNNPRTVSNIFI